MVIVSIFNVLVLVVYQCMAFGGIACSCLFDL